MSNIIKGKQGLIIPKTKAIWLSQKEKEKMLIKEAAEAFATASARKKRARDNKWFRWKYFDQNFEEEDWLNEQKIDMGWAIGRRIYEKAEIEVKTRVKSSIIISVSRESASTKLVQYESLRVSNGRVGSGRVGSKIVKL